MIQEEDEDAFLYGQPEDAAQTGTPSAPRTTADHEMEPASEEGEVDDDEAEEDDSDSVHSTLDNSLLIQRILS
jgi:hypothetical protein